MESNFTEARLGGEILEYYVNTRKTYWNSRNSVIVTN